MRATVDQHAEEENQCPAQRACWFCRWPPDREHPGKDESMPTVQSQEDSALIMVNESIAARRGVNEAAIAVFGGWRILCD